VPWWYGAHDVYLSVFGMVWLAFVALMCGFALTSGTAAMLVVLVPSAAGGLYPAAGRVLHRRMRICRSSYIVTSKRVIASWQLTREPVIIKAHLGQLLPPVIRREAIFADLANPDWRARGQGWRRLTWPAATTNPPVLIGIAEAVAVRDVISAAQLALRATASG